MVTSAPAISGVTVPKTLREKKTTWQIWWNCCCTQYYSLSPGFWFPRQPECLETTWELLSHPDSLMASPIHSATNLRRRQQPDMLLHQRSEGIIKLLHCKTWVFNSHKMIYSLFQTFVQLLLKGKSMKCKNLIFLKCVLSCISSS